MVPTTLGGRGLLVLLDLGGVALRSIALSLGGLRRRLVAGLGLRRISLSLRLGLRLGIHLLHLLLRLHLGLHLLGGRRLALLLLLGRRLRSGRRGGSSSLGLGLLLALVALAALLSLILTHSIEAANHRAPPSSASNSNSNSAKEQQQQQAKLYDTGARTTVHALWETRVTIKGVSHLKGRKGEDEQENRRGETHADGAVSDICASRAAAACSPLGAGDAS